MIAKTNFQLFISVRFHISPPRLAIILKISVLGPVSVVAQGMETALAVRKLKNTFPLEALLFQSDTDWI